MKLFFVLASLFVTVCTSCRFVGGKRIHGNGEIKMENRNERDFDGLEVGGALNVYIRQDSAYSVRIETDVNLMQFIETYTSSNTLVVRQKEGHNLRPSSSIKVYVSGPQFKHLDISGASHLYSEGKISSNTDLLLDLSGASSAELDIKSPAVGVEVSGASKARLTGETRDLDVEGGGASHVKCYGLMSENATVDVSGASSAEVFASVKIAADASGASHIRYKGSAAVTRASESGAGSVRKED